jgi:preprotein translocase subunit SecG
MSSSIFNLVLLAHVLVGLSVIGLVLVQHGKGADMGAAFGSGASGSLFGSSGSANFLSRTTAALATVFFITSLSLSYMAGKRPAESSSILERDVPASLVPAESSSEPSLLPSSEPSSEVSPEPSSESSSGLPFELVPAESAPAAETPAPAAETLVPAGQGSAADAIPE